MSDKSVKRNRLNSNSGAVKMRIYIAPVDWFTTIGEPTVLTQAGADNDVADIAARDAIVSPADGDTAYVQSNELFYKYVAASTSWVRAYKSSIETAHVFATDKGFYILEATKNKRGIEFSGPEDHDVTGFEANLTVSVPGIDKELADFLMKSGLESYIVIVETNDGEKIQMGTLNNPATIKLSGGGTGTEVLNYKGLELSIMSEGNTIQFYDVAGALSLLAD